MPFQCRTSHVSNHHWLGDVRMCIPPPPPKKPSTSSPPVEIEELQGEGTPPFYLEGGKSIFQGVGICPDVLFSEFSILCHFFPCFH